MGQNFREKNYYEILEVSTTATSEEIYQAYQRTKNAYSLDSLALYSLMSQEECEHILEMIEEAFSVLREPAKRKQYDTARGLNQEHNYKDGNPFKYQSSKEDSAKQKSELTNSDQVGKMVVQKRFALEYKVDEEFEKEIEQTSEFSGEFLKRVRQYKQVDIPRLADMTKVSKTYIRYIEEEDVKNLPALVYVRGFVYQYAKCLKLNPDMVATSYMHRLKRLKGEL